MTAGPDGCAVDAWGPDRITCLTEALTAVVATFAEVPEAPATQVFPLAADSSGTGDDLVALLEAVVYAVNVLYVVPVRFHLAETENGGVAGDMEVVPASDAVLLGPIPRGVSYHGFEVGHGGGTWRCHVPIEY